MLLFSPKGRGVASMNFKRIHPKAGLRLAAAVLAIGLAAGCTEQRILIRVEPDGSGQIVCSSVVLPHAVPMYETQMASVMEAMSRHGRGDSATNAPPDPFFNEKALKAQARRFGAGVKLVKAAPYDRNGARGSVAVYAFKDINDVCIDVSGQMQRVQSMMESFHPDEDDNEAEASLERPERAIEFRLDKGPAPRLRITMPPMPESDQDMDAPDNDEAEQAEETEAAMYENPQFFGYMGAMQDMDEDAMAMAMSGQNERAMMQGVRIVLEVEAAGARVRSNASRPRADSTNRFTLVDFDLNKAMPSLKTRRDRMWLQMAVGMGSMPKGLGDKLKNTPGIFWETNKTVTVEFL